MMISHETTKPRKSMEVLPPAANISSLSFVTSCLRVKLNPGNAA